MEQTLTEKLRCPDCGERAGVEILYGLPSPEAVEAEARGELALGGCMMPWRPLHFRCLACSWEWGRPLAPGDAA